MKCLIFIYNSEEPGCTEFTDEGRTGGGLLCRYLSEDQYGKFLMNYEHCLNDELEVIK